MKDLKMLVPQLMTIEADGKPIMVTSQDHKELDLPIGDDQEELDDQENPETGWDLIRTDFDWYGISDDAELSFRKPTAEEEIVWVGRARAAIREGELDSMEQAYEGWAVWLVAPTPEAIAEEQRDLEELE
jgi:hypothetical protein